MLYANPVTDITAMINAIGQVDPIRPIEMIAPEDKILWPVQKKRQPGGYVAVEYGGTVCVERVGVGQAIRQERLGAPIDRFEELFLAESEDHLDGAIEYLGGAFGMSFNDVVNQVNVD